MCNCGGSRSSDEENKKKREIREMVESLYYARYENPDKVLLGIPSKECKLLDLPKKTVGFNTFMMSIAGINYGSEIYYNERLIDCPITMGKLKISRGDSLVIL